METHKSFSYESALVVNSRCIASIERTVSLVGMADMSYAGSSLMAMKPTTTPKFSTEKHMYAASKSDSSDLISLSKHLLIIN
jgi:hypothetical protein